MRRPVATDTANMPAGADDPGTLPPVITKRCETAVGMRGHPARCREAYDSPVAGAGCGKGVEWPSNRRVQGSAGEKRCTGRHGKDPAGCRSVSDRTAGNRARCPSTPLDQSTSQALGDNRNRRRPGIPDERVTRRRESSEWALHAPAPTRENLRRSFDLFLDAPGCDPAPHRI